MSEPGWSHAPVLLDETMAALEPRSGGCYLDGTVGLGGHAERILQLSGPDGRLIGLDRDPEALAISANRLSMFEDRCTLLHAGYEEAALAAGRHGCPLLEGILLDLGISSLQIDRPERGFSFRSEGPIDMRFDPTSGEPAAAVVNGWPEAEIATLIWELGEEPASRRIARAIVRARPLRSTVELAAVVERAVARPHGRTSPATRTFQALRIAVNGELDNLRSVLRQAAGMLRLGGRLVIISFHSLEDRIVKQFIQQESRGCVCPPELPECRCTHRATFKPIQRAAMRASPEEQQINPRSRSAKLRAAIRI